MISFAALADLLGVDGDPHGLEGRTLHAARVVSTGLPRTVLTMIERDSGDIGPVGRMELERTRARARVYQGIAAWDEAACAQIGKGMTIAAFWEPGVERHTGDLDLCVPTWDDAWCLAGRVVDRFPVERVQVQTHDGDRHVGISLSWSAPDPLYEPDLHVDVMTTPYVGDGQRLTVREYDPLLAPATQSVLMLLEERLQRPFRPTDLLDLAYLAPSLDPVAVASAASSWGLARELDELMTSAEQYEVVPAAVVAAVRREAESVTGSDPAPVPSLVEVGLLLPTQPRVRSGLPPVRLDVSGSSVLRSSVGDFLMLTEPTVDEETVESVVRYLDADGRRTA